MEPHRLGWEPLLASWLARLRPVIGGDLVALFERLFKWQLAACLHFVRREVKEQSPTEDSALAANTMRLIESMLDEFQPVAAPEGAAATADAGKEGADKAAAPEATPGPAHALDAATRIKWVEAVFLFAVVWGVGATGGLEDRVKFDRFLRELCSGATPAVRSLCSFTLRVTHSWLPTLVSLPSGQLWRPRDVLQ